MSGVSVGWFDPTLFHPQPDQLVQAIQRFLTPQIKRTRAWPLAVSSIRMGGKGTGVAYAMVDGHIPIHIDQVGLYDSDGRIFQFILAVANRPALLAAPEKRETTPIFQGFAPPTIGQTFGLGGVEMKVGMAVHFDITTHWHGVTSLPVPMESLSDDLKPRAIIVQVAGFASDQIGPAAAHAANLIALDMQISERTGKVQL